MRTGNRACSMRESSAQLPPARASVRRRKSSRFLCVFADISYKHDKTLRCIYVLTTLLLTSALFAQQPETYVPPTRLHEVHTIFVDSLEDEMIRAKVIADLVKGGRFKVVENPDLADAI